ncbi:MAG TPA: SLBB domain-containing protein, partial [Pseudonocardiaceae bacterium]|nr:SLBB domain-containing protein [Pseudonocardiaceae bacterium]
MTEPLRPLTEPVHSLADYLDVGGGIGLARALDSAPASVRTEVRVAGLRGRGGTGGLTAEKWAATDRAGGAVSLICNAAESQPGSFKDRFILRNNPYQVVEGLAIAAHALAARRAFIAITRTYGAEIVALHNALTDMRAAGLLGPAPIQLVYGPDEYLFGLDAVLADVVEAGKPWPETLDARCVEPGVARDVVVHNVETLAALPGIIRRGADAFRTAGTDQSPGTAVFTVSGDVRLPGVHELPYGLPVRVLVDLVCGGTLPGRRTKAVFAGIAAAPLAGATLDTPLDADLMRAVGSSLGAGGFVVYDDSACMVAAALVCCEFLAASVRCGCLATLARLLGLIEEGAGRPSHVEELGRCCARLV